MPSTSVTEPMPCGAPIVFDLLHDYARRLEWDTLLREAWYTRGHTRVGVGATTLCVGRPFFGLIGIETTYVAFIPAVLAAVQMINQPPFFASFGASIRHAPTPTGSTVTYKLTFRARPRWLRGLLEPVILVVLRYETKRRLQSLARFLATRQAL